MLKPLIVWLTKKLQKILKDMGIPGHLICFLRDLYAVSKNWRSNTLESDIKQRTGSRLGKEYITAVYFYLAYLTSMLSTSWKMQGWMSHKLESRLLGEISTTSGMQMIPESEEKLNSLLMRVKEESEKAGLKLSILKTKIMASGPNATGLHQTWTQEKSLYGD